MVNAEELAICRRRGHKTPGLRPEGGWMQCEHCGIWLREIVTKEEREDEPPEAELNSGVRSDRALADMKRRIEEKSGQKE